MCARKPASAPRAPPRTSTKTAGRSYAPSRNFLPSPVGHRATGELSYRLGVGAQFYRMSATGCEPLSRRRTTRGGNREASCAVKGVVHCFPGDRPYRNGQCSHANSVHHHVRSLACHLRIRFACRGQLGIEMADAARPAARGYCSSGQIKRRAMKLRKAVAPAHNSAKQSAAPAISGTLVAIAWCVRPNVLSNPATIPSTAPYAAARETLHSRGLSPET